MDGSSTGAAGMAAPLSTGGPEHVPSVGTSGPASAGIARVVRVAAAAAEASLLHHNPDASANLSDGVRQAARAAAVTAHAVLSSPPSSRAPVRDVAEGRRKRSSITLETKLRIIQWRAAGKAWPFIHDQLGRRYSQSALEKIYQQRTVLVARAEAGAPATQVTAKAGAYPAVDAQLLAWCTALRARGRKRVPLSLAILRCKALEIASSLGVTNFSASNGYIQGWARRNGWTNVALHGSGASANVEEAATRMAEIRRQLEGVDPDLVYNVDETGLLYRCLPSRSYVPSADRRLERGSKAMKSKDRVTLTLCCNSNGTHKLPVTMIGKAVQPLCFTGDGNRCPLPYFSQKSAWTDTNVFQRWFQEVFLPAIKRRTRSHVFLIMDNLGCHGDISDPQVTIIELPPNTTAVYQPLDAGVIAALKRRYKFRLLQHVVRNLNDLVASAGPAPVVPRGGGLEQGGQAHLLDAARIIDEEWWAIPTEHLANCWLKANVLPVETVAEVRRTVHGIAPAFDNVHMDVSDIIALMANTSLADEFDGVSHAGREEAARLWLNAEDDCEAIGATVDMVVLSEEGDDE